MHWSGFGISLVIRVAQRCQSITCVCVIGTQKQTLCAVQITDIRDACVCVCSFGMCDRQTLVIAARARARATILMGCTEEPTYVYSNFSQSLSLYLSPPCVAFGRRRGFRSQRCPSTKVRKANKNKPKEPLCVHLCMNDRFLWRPFGVPGESARSVTC